MSTPQVTMIITIPYTGDIDELTGSACGPDQQLNMEQCQGLLRAALAESADEARLAYFTAWHQNDKSETLQKIPEAERQQALDGQAVKSMINQLALEGFRQAAAARNKNDDLQ